MTAADAERLDDPDELTTRNRRGAIYDARMTAADAKRLDKPDESTAPTVGAPFMTPDNRRRHPNDWTNPTS